MKRCVLIAAVVLGVSTASLQAGEVVTVNFTGEVSKVNYALNIFPGVSVGDPVSGTYSYDTNAPDSSPDPGKGWYLTTGTLTVEIGSWTFQSVSGSSTTGNDPPWDGFRVYSGDFTPSIPGATPLEVSVRFIDNEGTALSSDALPTVAPDLSEYETKTGIVAYEDAADPFVQSFILLDITSVELKGGPPPIPTVSQWGIAIMALLLLVGGKVYFRRRRATAA